MTNVESQNILLECKDLLVGYGKALPSMKFPFDFSLASGNVVALMGENGCGKSSLLKTFAGLLAPVAGEVSLEGKSLTEWAPRERAQEISLVRMSSAVPPRMSVSEFVRLGRSPYSGIFDSRTEEDNRIVENSMALLDVANFANRPIAELSDGERSRVFLAEAVAQQVKILLLDEPNAFFTGFGRDKHDDAQTIFVGYGFEILLIVFEWQVWNDHSVNAHLHTPLAELFKTEMEDRIQIPH